MGRFWGKLLFMVLLLMPTTLMLVNQGRSNVAFATDSMEGEDDDATVETETDTPKAEAQEVKEKEAEEAPAAAEEEAQEAEILSPSPDADTTILFTKPSNPLELPAGKQVRILVGLTNKGKVDFYVDSMEASFRYPQDYNFYLQNFTAMTFGSAVEPKRQGSFEYGFVPNEAFSSRPFGLVVNINYKDANGKMFQTSVFNETIQVTEPDE
jgi:translocon-associated protein subunit alpha